jgi:hypothetical protein
MRTVGKIQCATRDTPFNLFASYANIRGGVSYSGGGLWESVSRHRLVFTASLASGARVGGCLWHGPGCTRLGQGVGAICPGTVWYDTTWHGLVRV